MPVYTQYTFAQLKQSLADQLDDSSKVFWTDAELGIHIQDAIRFWNALTGDNRVWYQLNADPTLPNAPWYDLQTIAGSPRQCTLTDLDCYTRLQYALLEPIAPNGALSTGQFRANTLIQQLQLTRDQFLFMTDCTSSIRTLPVNPNVTAVGLPQSVIEVRRAYWIPSPDVQGQKGVYPFPLPRMDQWAAAAFSALPSNFTNPIGFSAGTEPPLTIDLYPAPAFNGSVELITIESQAPLSPTPSSSPTVILIPNDFMPGLVWGVLADLMENGMEEADSVRAKYAHSRYEQYMELLRIYPSALIASVGFSPVAGMQTHVDAVEILDQYSPLWRMSTARPAVIGLSGRNLVAFPTSVEQLVNLYMVGNANIPTADGQFIQLGQEVVDVIVEYSQHTASFKMGGEEFSRTMPLLEHFVELAAQRNAKIRTLSTFRELLIGRAVREDQIAPTERTAEEANN